jgi:hypothetical protein
MSRETDVEKIIVIFYSLLLVNLLALLILSPLIWLLNRFFHSSFISASTENIKGQ